MIFKLKTTKETDEIMKTLKKQLGFTNNIIARLAIALSLRNTKFSKEEIDIKFNEYDNLGFDFPRHVLLGGNEIAYKCLMEKYCGITITEAEFFPNHTKFHIENGMKYLVNEMKSAKNTEKLIKELVRGR